MQRRCGLARSRSPRAGVRARRPPDRPCPHLMIGEHVCVLGAAVPLVQTAGRAIALVAQSKASKKRLCQYREARAPVSARIEKYVHGLSRVYASIEKYVHQSECGLRR